MMIKMTEFIRFIFSSPARIRGAAERAKAEAVLLPPTVGLACLCCVYRTALYLATRCAMGAAFPPTSKEQVPGCRVP